MDTKYKFAGDPLRALIMNMLEGYAYCKMLFADGIPHDFAYLEVNPAFLQLTGLNDVIGKNVSEVIPGIQLSNPELFEIYGRVASTGNPERFETYISELSIWLTISVYCPELGYFVATFDNITKRKEKEFALANSEEQFRLMFENTLQGVVFQNERGEIYLANQKAQDILGLTLNQMQGRTSIDPRWKSIHEDGSDFLGETHPAMVALKSGKSVEDVIMGVFNPDSNQTRWIKISAVPLKGSVTNQLTQVFTSFDDITVQRANEIALNENEGNLKLFIEHAPSMLAMFNTEMQYIAVSGIWKKVYALGDRNIIGVSHYDLFPEIPERWKKIHRRCLAGEVIRAEEDHFERADGTVQWLRWEVRPWHKGDGSIGGVIFFSEDITERIVKENELRIAAIAFESHEGMTITDSNGTIIRVNHAFTKITGYTAEEVIGKNPRILSSGKHDKAFYAAMWESINKNGYWEGEIWNKRKNGEIFPEFLTIATVKNIEGNVSNFVATLNDITLSKKAEVEIQRFAFYDSLTNLPNRRLLDDRIEQAIVASKRSGLFGAVLFLDLDNFKPLNDTHGHKAGDLLLIEVARRLVSCVREVDTVSRFGGDEFVIVLSELDNEKLKSISQAKTIAEKIRTTLAEPYWLSSKPQGTNKMVVHQNLGVSIGMVIFNKNYNAESILQWADKAMYQAKENGRNQIRFYEQ
jgi:diguanylate cyclase (GGDEF)-like protein/PAS domain S-box-containing protein